MKLYIGNIPENIDDFNLRKFFSLFGEEAATFRVVTKDSGDKVYRFGYAEITSPSLAQRLIREYNGANFDGNTLHIREYHERTPLNERRAPAWAAKPYHGPERRRSERRLPDLSLLAMDAAFS
jgi:RNA recognition motif-containing protein